MNPSEISIDMTKLWFAFTLLLMEMKFQEERIVLVEGVASKIPSFFPFHVNMKR